MIILGESYSRYIWAAFALVLVGAYLVRPRDQETLAPRSSDGQDKAQQKQRAVR